MTAYENSVTYINYGNNTGWKDPLEPLKTTNRLVYNAGISKEAYFRSQSAQTGGFNIGNQSGLNGRNGLWRILQTDTAGNTPASVDWASSLWSKAQAYKGMISASKHKEALPATDDKDAAKTTPFPSPESFDKVNYAFQFHYNPGSISMTYGGPPGVDIALQASGREEYLTFGSAAGTGTITVQLFLNRINDMKYFDPATGRLKSGVSPNIFAGRAPSAAELGDIYNRGTMYDLEFLFRTLLGFARESFMGRGMSWDNKTSDLGHVGGKPVEIHLGKSLRYLCRVVDIQVRHVLFTERMVPTFTDVTITVQRLPDIGPETRPAYTKVTEPPAQTGPITEPGGTSATVAVAGNGVADPWAPLKWLWDNAP